MVKITTALTNLEWSFDNSLTLKPGKTVWPITMGTFVVFPKVTQNPEQTTLALKFIIWSFLNSDILVHDE